MSDETQLEVVIFDAAQAITDADQRRAMIEAACRNNDELRKRVNNLLAAHDGAESFMQQPAVEFSDETIASRPTEKPGATIGRYKLLEQIGEGGFGVVYMADQLRPIERRVALKVIKLGMDSKQVVARFEAERQALALMDHPNIAKILDAGTTETGRPYFVMELVRGIPVTEYCDDRGLTTEQRLKLFSQICSAVQHAHQKGIIHRDIKPSNILVSTNGDDAVPKVIDFGIAKATQGRLTDKTLFTQFRQFIGTPAYMSPEQAQMSAVDVDTRSDIYSLGVLLYELLTGKTPLDSKSLVHAGYEEICRRIREEEALKPSKRLSSLQQEELTTLAKQRKTAASQFSASVQGDLDWIVMKAVEKDRSRRYESCGALAADVDRFLNDEAVSAGPPSVTYHLRKFLRRNRSAAMTISAFAVVLLLGAVGSLVGWRNAAIANKELDVQVTTTKLALGEANESRIQAQKAEQELSRRVYQLHLTTADQALLNGDYLRARVELDACASESRSWEWDLLDERFRATFPADLPNSTSPLFSKDGKRLFTVGKLRTTLENTIGIWNTVEGEFSRTLPTEVPLVSLTSSPDESLLAGASRDGYQLVLRADTGKVLWSVKEHNRRFSAMTFSSDGQLLLSSNSEAGNVVKVVDALTKKEQFEMTLEHNVSQLRFSPDGRWLGAGGWNKSEPPVIIDLAEGRKVVARFPEGNTKLAFNPVTEEIATGSQLGVISIWNWDGTELSKQRDWLATESSAWPAGVISALEYSPDGSRLVCGDQGYQVTVWDPSQGREIARFDAGDTPWSVAFHRGKQDQIAFSTLSGGLRLWRYSSAQEGTTRKVIAGKAIARFSPDCKRVLVSLEQHWGRGEAHVHVLDAATAEPVAAKEIVQPLHTATWTDRLRIATGINDLPNVRIFDSDTGEPMETYTGPADQVLFDVASSDDRLVAVYGDGTIGSWNMNLGDQPAGEFFGNVDHQFGIYGIGFSHDVKLVATAFWEENTIEIWDVPKKRRRHLLSVPKQLPQSIHFVENSESIYVGSNGGRLTKIELATGQESRRYVGHSREIHAIALSPDESQIVSGDSAGKVIVWDAETTQPIVTLTNGEQAIHSLDWSSDGQRIVAGKADGTIQIWTVNASSE